MYGSFLMLLFFPFSKAYKLGELLVEEQVYRANRAVTVLGDDKFRYVFIFGFRVIVVFAVQEHYNIGVLFQRARFAQVRKHRAFYLTRFHAAAELRQCDNRHIQFTRQCFQRTGNFGNFLLAVAA